MRIETDVPYHLYSVLSYKCVSRMTVFSKQVRIFALKIWYESGFPQIVAEWGDHFDPVPPTCKDMYIDSS